MIIGLAGRAYSGKTTIAKYLEKEHGFKRCSFAEPLKQMILKAGMCSEVELYIEKSEKSRWLMQKIGTEIFRKQVDRDFWIKKAKRMILDIYFENKTDIVFDDIRFPNEAKLITDHVGTLIKVVRKDYVPLNIDNNHDSERFVDDIIPDCIITATSGDVEGLIKQTDEILKRRKT